MTIAGTDSGGGAGVHADCRTFFACGVHATTAVTAVTVQNSVGVSGFHEIPPEVVAAQIEAVVTDIGVTAAKTGMLASAPIIEAIAATIDKVGIGRDHKIPFVVDPVSASMHGDQLLADNALAGLKSLLFRRASLVTPNLDEVRLLTGIDVRRRDQMLDAAKAMFDFGPQWVLIKAGHLREDPECVDILYDGVAVIELPGPRFDVQHTHGSGDTLASSITSALAKGATMPAAVEFGKRFIVQAVRNAYPLGHGTGPVSNFWRLSEAQF
ncbi:bifunctional hydroxymethylpyrimidine kinase/phosphomethylpyrimidine kinase [Kutzneria chonburiensis]|uniref:bifunctional hydroxymethylpyrimidine kinase/phosphomethylpyrimidine kinase n=1 Tax=Kutzneria chonburiensis TaxID=1483604 RepID=UPI0023602FF0|nr:bifunctional hydroxymethylpyrimidine kinase/phosphomethylpyrimidine kinase [Kutzneria chonburiensis]